MLRKKLIPMSKLNVKVNGVEEVNRELERRLGGKSMERILDKALLAGAAVVKKELERNFESFKDTGASKDEITISKPMTLNGTRTVVIYWSGPKKRHTIIHLNEFGTIKNPSPRGKGAVERALRAGQAEYLRVVKKEIARMIS